MIQDAFDDKTTHIVSFWHIPGGTDYEGARAVEVFIDNEAEAVAFQERHSRAPEMAVLITREEYLRFKTKLAALKPRWRTR